MSLVTGGPHSPPSFIGGFLHRREIILVGGKGVTPFPLTRFPPIAQAPYASRGPEVSVGRVSLVIELSLRLIRTHPKVPLGVRREVIRNFCY